MNENDFMFNHLECNILKQSESKYKYHKTGNKKGLSFNPAYSRD